MKRKFWSIKEIVISSRGLIKVSIHCALVWNCRDIHDIRKSPMRFEIEKIESRWRRAWLALLEPKKDQALLKLESLCADIPAVYPIYKKLEATILRTSGY